MWSWLVTIGAVLALLNIKVLPSVFIFRFYWLVFKNLVWFRNKSSRSIFEKSISASWTPLLELDMYLHKSNSTYFSDMDLSRSDLMTKVLKHFYMKFGDPDLPPLKFWQFVYTPLGSVNMVFRREIKAYMPYKVESQIVGWTQKWLFIVTLFKSINGKTIYAYGTSKYVLKQERKTINPQTAIEFSGLLTKEAIERNEKAQKYFEKSLDLEDIIKIVD